LLLVPTFHIEQFGCRATQADGAAIERQLLDRGCSPASDASRADIIVINTCTVTAAADAQARDAIRKFHSSNPSTQLIVTGCYAQRAPEELSQLPGVSWVVGNSHKPQIPNLIDFGQNSQQSPSSYFPLSVLQSFPTEPSTNSKRILVGDLLDRESFLAAPVLGGEGNHTRPTLKIQDGCNSRCSYCVIPFVRGESRSLAPSLVIQEIDQLTSSGYREIILSGINLGTYGRDLSPRVELQELLRLILRETSIERLRLSSIEPLDVTQDLIDLFASSDRLARHFHIPLQSGSDRILAGMRRWYRAEHYARRVSLISEKIPGAAIGADVITGFPGETDEDHSTTLSFIENLPFTYLHVFSYSERPGTTAASLDYKVPADVIKRRARELRALSESKSSAFRQSQLGHTLRVLTLRSGENESSDTTPALSSNYVKVRVRGSHARNQWLDVCPASVEGNYLLAELASASSL
jgi:threonylcarbamoyladenosine tRNA methylthiotransferase MtaB